MTTATIAEVDVEPRHIRALLSMLKLRPADGSPLVPWLSVDEEPATLDELLGRGLVVDEGGSHRVNQAVGVAVATLARADAIVELHRADATGERTRTLAGVGEHWVGFRADQPVGSVRFPLARPDLVAVAHAAIDSADWSRAMPAAPVDVVLRPAGPFLIGVLVRSSGPLTVGEISVRADDAMSDLSRVLGTATMAPGTIDRLHRDPVEVQYELLQLVDAGAVVEHAKRYRLAPAVEHALTTDPIAAMSATRVDFGPARRDRHLQLLAFADSILAVRTSGTGDGSTVRLVTVDHAMAASLLAAMFVRDDQLRAWAVDEAEISPAD